MQENDPLKWKNELEDEFLLNNKIEVTEFVEHTINYKKLIRRLPSKAITDLEYFEGSDDFFVETKVNPLVNCFQDYLNYSKDKISDNRNVKTSKVEKTEKISGSLRSPIYSSGQLFSDFRCQISTTQCRIKSLDRRRSRVVS